MLLTVTHGYEVDAAMRSAIAHHYQIETATDGDCERFFI